MEPRNKKSWQHLIQDNMILGLGTGSTVYHLIVKLAERVRGGLSIHAAATSARTEELAAHYGIPLIPFHDAEQIHLAIDGVDAIDPDVTGAVHTVEFENRISRKPGIIQNKASLIDACRILRRYVWRIDRE